MERLFTLLGSGLEGSPLMALAVSFIWGILSFVLSPCHMASVSLLLGVMVDGEDSSPRRAFWMATCFAVGMLAAVVGLGVVTVCFGRLAGDTGGWGAGIAAVVFVLVGLHLLEVVQIPFPGLTPAPGQKRGLLTAVALGAVSGGAIGPCTFAFMAPVLVAAFGMASTAPLMGAALLVAYGVGHAGVIVAVASSTDLVSRWLQWSRHGVGWFRRACGILALCAAVYLLRVGY